MASCVFCQGFEEKDLMFSNKSKLLYVQVSYLSVKFFQFKNTQNQIRYFYVMSFGFFLE